MNKKYNRREFVKNAGKSVIGIGLMSAYSRKAFSYVSANDKITVAIIGTNSRGSALARGFVRSPAFDVAYICDVDDNAMEKGIDAVRKAGQEKKVTGIKDFRKILEDKSIDAVVIATPDHWHAIATLMALKAGKHVYVEKPGSHNPYEGELVTEAIVKYNKVVQVGAQRRSWFYVREALELLKSGIIGTPHFARTWYGANRGPIGYGKPVPVPADLNYDLWQGAAPRRPFKDNIIHYNWHWFWHWGTGELLNNGTHFVDLARLGLGVNHPSKVSSHGGRYAYHDDWETPDIQITVFDFPENKTISWEGKCCNKRPVEGMTSGVSFHSEQGTMIIMDNSYVVYDIDNKEIKISSERDSAAIDLTGPALDRDSIHIMDFAEAIHTGKKPNSSYKDVNRSITMLHLGNIAHRLGKTINCNPLDGKIIDDPDALKLWKREYEPGWEPML